MKTIKNQHKAPQTVYYYCLMYSEFIILWEHW